MPKENRNPPQSVMMTALETKLDRLIELVSEVLALVQPAMKADAKAKK